MHRYSIVVFLGAFLLFQVQPLIAKVILPWFGGTASVWNTCMMFFQIALLLGYLYSHGLRMLLKPRTSWIVHSVVLLLALLTLPVLPSESLKPESYDSFSFEIVKVLALSVGVPFFVLATTGPLIQAWQSVSHGGDSESEKSNSPYRLYALSNVGSLLALISYPFLFEPNLRLQSQSLLWSGMFVLFVVMCISSGTQVRKLDSWHQDVGEPKHESPSKISPLIQLLWLVLAILPSIMLLATTNLMCQEIASVPFLWILPLTLYLISFIICFEKPTWYHRGIFVPLLLLGVTAGVTVALLNVHASAMLQVALLSVSLFACGMTCHGELERLKPHISKLTLFYLFVSLGGSLGGIFVVLIAPRIFTGFPEYQLALIGSLIVGVGLPCYQKTIPGGRKIVLGFVALIIGGLVLANLIASLTRTQIDGVLLDARNEYGIFSVEEDENRLVFISGNIDHGSQIILPEPSLEPHSYYADGSGFSICIKTQRDIASKEQPPRKGLKVGVLGLGIGSMLSWATPEDNFVFYEINPKVEEIAREWFTFLNSHKRSEVVIGDGRIMLEMETKKGIDRQFDLLAIDAFSSDSIPVHLLTDECFDVYQKHLKEDGILLFHISNRFINLKPVIFATTKKRGLTASYIVHKSSEDESISGSDWILVTNNKVASHARIKSVAIDYELPANAPQWTDDFASLAPVMNWSVEISWDKMFEGHRMKKQSKAKQP